MSVQKLKINKLFFNKWPYKIECTLSGAWAASSTRLNDKSFDNWMHEDQPHKWSRRKPKFIDKFIVKELRDAVFNFRDKDIKIRGEADHLHIYCKDITLFSEIEAALQKWISKTWGPSTDKELDYLLGTDTRMSVCDKLPHGTYHYKVSIKEKVPIDIREKFYEWSIKYPKRILMPKSTKMWMSNLRKYNYAPYMYVSDDKMLTLVGLYLGGDIKHIEEFIVRASINTP